MYQDKQRQYINPLHNNNLKVDRKNDGIPKKSLNRNADYTDSFDYHGFLTGEISIVFGHLFIP